MRKLTRIWCPPEFKNMIKWKCAENPDKKQYDILEEIVLEFEIERKKKRKEDGFKGIF